MARILIFSDKNFRNYETLNIRKDYRRYDSIICVSDLMNVAEIFERRIYNQFDLFILDLMMGALDNETRTHIFWLFDYIKHKPVFFYDDVKIVDFYHTGYYLLHRRISVDSESAFKMHDRCDIFVPINECGAKKIGILTDFLNARKDKNDLLITTKAKLDMWIELPYIYKRFPRLSENLAYYSPRDRKTTVSAYYDFLNGTYHDVIISDKNILNPKGILLFLKSPYSIPKEKKYIYFCQYFLSESEDFSTKITIVNDNTKGILNNDMTTDTYAPRLIIRKRNIFMDHNKQETKLLLFDIHHPGRIIDTVSDELITALRTIYGKGKKGISYRALIYKVYGEEVKEIKLHKNKNYRELYAFFLALRNSIEECNLDPNLFLKVARTNKLKLYCDLIIE